MDNTSYHYRKTRMNLSNSDLKLFNKKLVPIDADPTQLR